MLKLKTIFILFLCIASICSMSVHAQGNQGFNQYDSKSYPKGSDYDLRHTETKKSDNFIYRYYQQYIDGVPVWQARYIEVLRPSNMEIIKAYDHSTKAKTVGSIPSRYNSELLDSLQRVFPHYQESYYWYPKDGVLLPYLKIDIENDHTSYIGFVDLSTGFLEYLRPNTSYAGNRIDSSIQALIFMPDPLTASHTKYGMPILDRSDSSYLNILNTRTWETIPCMFDMDSLKFIPENEYLILKDITSPISDSFYYMSDSVDVDRTDYRFEEMMVLGHIGSLNNWLESVGLNMPDTFKVLVDPHAIGGADNSRHSSFMSNRASQLEFGTGGVDDAEDAQVIVHEYGHEIIFRLSGLFSASLTNDTKGLHEGLCDYFASAYRYRIDTFGWRDVFPWDGHNEYWDGRTADTNLTYSPTIFNFYTIGEIFNTALMKVARDRDIDSLTSLVLESIYLHQTTTTLEDAADIILDMDSILYGEKMRPALCKAFYEAGLNTKCDSSDSILEKELSKIKVLNSASFGRNEDDLVIQLPEMAEKIEVIIYNNLGQLIHVNYFDHTDKVSVKPLYKSGSYIIRCISDSGEWSLPVIVW